MRALGFDLGERRIGVAIGDDQTWVATPVSVLHRSGDRSTDHQAMADLVSEWEATVVVVGMPYSLDGSRGSAARAVSEEISQLGSFVDVPIQTYDERLSTVTANRELVEQGLDGRKRRKVVDQVAASVILQHWLDSRRRLGRL